MIVWRITPQRGAGDSWVISPRSNRRGGCECRGTCPPCQCRLPRLQRTCTANSTRRDTTRGRISNGASKAGVAEASRSGGVTASAASRSAKVQRPALEAPAGIRRARPSTSTRPRQRVPGTPENTGHATAIVTTLGPARRIREVGDRAGQGEQRSPAATQAIAWARHSSPIRAFHSTGEAGTSSDRPTAWISTRATGTWWPARWRRRHLANRIRRCRAQQDPPQPDHQDRRGRDGQHPPNHGPHRAIRNRLDLWLTLHVAATDVKTV